MNHALRERASEQSNEQYVVTRASMGTVVSILVVGSGGSARARRERARLIDNAFAWFESIERACSRFDESSELRQLCTRVGTPVTVSPVLFEAVQFALAVAGESDGAFDPTVGVRMETGGFDREYRSGSRIRSGVAHTIGVSYRDVELDADTGTITLHQPLLLDLGAVAKGLAIDTAARELAPLGDFLVDAGGDLYCGGRNATDEAWALGIRHPREPDALLETVRVSDCAVCTSGDYERKATEPGNLEHHIVRPETGTSATAAASVTVIAASAMVADALSTAAFVLGPARGTALLERNGVEGLLVTPALERFHTRSWRNAVSAQR